MARKMATVLDAYSIGGTYSSDGSRLCTNTKAQEVGCNAVSGYASNQIVPVELLTKKQTLPSSYIIAITNNVYNCNGIYMFDTATGVTNSILYRCNEIDAGVSGGDINSYGSVFELVFTPDFGIDVNTVNGTTRTLNTGDNIRFWADVMSTAPKYVGYVKLQKANMSTTLS